VDDIHGQFESLIVKALKTGQAIGEMKKAVKEGQKAEKSLGAFIKEIQTRIGVQDGQ